MKTMKVISENGAVWRALCRVRFTRVIDGKRYTFGVAKTYFDPSCPWTLTEQRTGHCVRPVIVYSDDTAKKVESFARGVLARLLKQKGEKHVRSIIDATPSLPKARRHV